MHTTYLGCGEPARRAISLTGWRASRAPTVARGEQPSRLVRKFPWLVWPAATACEDWPMGTDWGRLPEHCGPNFGIQPTQPAMHAIQMGVVWFGQGRASVAEMCSKTSDGNELQMRPPPRERDAVPASSTHSPSHGRNWSHFGWPAGGMSPPPPQLLWFKVGFSQSTQENA